MSEKNSIHQQLAKLSCFSGALTVSDINQGDSEQCFKVIDQKGIYFVKYFQQQQTSIVRQQVSQLNQLTDLLNLSPKLVFSDQYWQVYPFIDGVTLNNLSLPITNKIEQAIKLMVSCHQDISKEKLTYFPELGIEEVVQPLTISLTPSQIDLISQITAKLVDSLKITPEVICHGDINFSNIIVAQQSWLIDFDCACLANPEFDIAMMYAVNELPEQSPQLTIDYCIDYYHQNAKMEVKPLKLLVMRYLAFSYLINGLWYYEQAVKQDSKLLLSKAKNQFNSFDQLKFVDQSLAEQMR